ncbi:MAG: hypothetical protein NVSMB49_17980 [Ktedonobacteraceae bacterium]
MQTIPLRRFQGMLAWTVVLVLMLLVTACSGVSGGSTGQTATGTTATTKPVTTPSATSVPPTATQPPAPTATSASSTAFKAGGISFIGPVKSITGSSLVMSAPNGQTVTMAITPQTDRSAFGGSLPTVGTSVDMDSVANPDGSFAATILKPAVPGDPDLNVIAYTGITTSAVGADRVLHFTAGVKSYTFTLPSTVVLSDFGGNAQAIGNNASVKVKVQFPANTVVSISNPNAGS